MESYNKPTLLRNLPLECFGLSEAAEVVKPV